MVRKEVHKDIYDNIDKVKGIAKLLDAYIRFRAKQEGVGYELNPEFFEKGIRNGIRKFFGVSFIEGKLLSDEDFPMVFELWNRETRRDFGEYYWSIAVDQAIPNVLMTPLERFLLTRIFESMPHNDGVYFFTGDRPTHSTIFLDGHETDHLLEAIEQTKDIDPELCVEVKSAMQRNGDTVQVDFDYCRVFQGIIRRSGGKLPYVTTQGAFTCSNMRPPDVGGMAEVITADAVEGVCTTSWAYNKLVELGLEKAE